MQFIGSQQLKRRMFSHRHRWFQNFLQGLQILGLLLVLCSAVWITPAIAQQQGKVDTVKVPIVIDGQEVFRVGSSGSFSAQERADGIHEQVKAAIASSTPPKLDIIQRNDLPTITLNDNHLLTVTNEDVLPGQKTAQQANTWRRRLQDVIERAQYERTPAYIRQATLYSIGAVGLAMLGYWLLGYVWRRSLRPHIQHHLTVTGSSNTQDPHPHTPSRLLRLAVNIGLLTIRTALAIGVLTYITRLFPWSRQWSYQLTISLVKGLTSPLLTIGQSKYSVIDMLVLVGMLFALFIVSSTFTDILKSRILHLAGVNRGAQETIAIIIRYSLVFIGAIVLLQVWGLDLSTLTILASSLGIGIGFGLQDIAKNFGSGVVLVFERPIQVGDFVEVGDFQGTVERIGARSTLVRTLDQVSIIVPNSRLLESEVINWSIGNPVSRLRLPIGVAYGSDLEVVKRALLEATQSHIGVLSTPAPEVFFIGFGDSSLDFELMVWTAEPSKQLRLKSDLYFKVDQLLRQYNIEIPFPQRDLHVRSGSLPLALSPEIEQALLNRLKPSSNDASWSNHHRS
jgi:small-conductance mechanosensitive channel